MNDTNTSWLNWDWVIANKEWLFSGVGLLVISLITSILGFAFLWNRMHKQRGQTSITQNINDNVINGPFHTGQGNININYQGKEIDAYVALTSEEIIGQNISFEGVIENLVHLDYQVFERLTERYEGSIDLLLQKWTNYPETGKIIFYNTQPVGYWTFAPLFEEAFCEFRSGKGFDGQITLDIIERIEFPGKYHLYFIGINLKKGHNNIIAKRVLFNSFIDTLEYLAGRGVYFEDICANAFTEAGKALCRHLEMDKITDHCDRGEIYYRRMYPFPNVGIFNERINLIRLYKSKFEQVGEIPFQQK